MADSVKKITVQVQAIVGNAVSSIDKFTTAVKKANDAKIDNRSADSIRKIGSEAETSAKKVAKLQAATSKLKSIVAGALTASAILGIGKAAVTASGQMELLRKGLEYTLGKADTSKLIKGIQEIGEKSAYDTNQLIPMSRAWINMGESADQAMGRIQKLVDLGSAFGLTTDQIEHANLALSQMAAAGKINAQDMMQLTNAGIPSWKMLADAMGMSVTQVRELAAQGKLTGDAINALWDTFEAKTQGAATTLASSLMGQTSNIEEAITNSMAVVGDIIRDAFDIQGVLAEVGTMVEGVKAHLMSIKEAAESIGMKQAILNELTSINPAVGAVASAFVSAFATIKKVVSENTGLIKNLVTAILLIKGTMVVVTGLAAAFTAVTGAIRALSIATSIFKAMQAGVLGVTTAVKLMTAVMNFNPVILAITLVCAALVMLYTHWDDVKKIVESAVNRIKEVVADALGFVVDFLENRLVKGVKTVGDAFVDFASMVLPSWASDSLAVISDMVDKACALLKSLADYARNVMNGFRNAVAVSRSAAQQELDPEERSQYAKKAHAWIDVPQAPKPSGGGGSVGAGKGGRGGGGGSKAKAQSEEEKAIESLIKKYSDADKMLKNVIKSEIEMAKIGVSMIPETARATEEATVKLMSLKAAHDEVLDGYEKELSIASKISDPSTRDSVIAGINKQIEAENRLFDAKAKQATFESNLKTAREKTETMLDKIFGTDDEYEREIKNIQDGVARIFETADYAKASGNSGDYSSEDMDLISKILNLSPDALQEELDLKIETLKESLAEGAKALTESRQNAKTWADNTVRYATMVGDSMANAMMDWITGAKSGKEALADFVSSILKSAAQLLTRWLSLFAIFSIVGDPRLAARNASAAVFGAYDGKVQLRKKGGFIAGAGTSTSDSIPAMLSNGEYVIRAAAVRKIGVPTLNSLNTGRYHFADGGYVGGKKLEPSGTVGGNLTLQVNALDASDFDSFLNLRGGGEMIRNMLYEAHRRFDYSMG